MPGVPFSSVPLPAPTVTTNQSDAPPRQLAPLQRRAVRLAMRVFRDDDLARGISPASRMWCAVCAGWRSAPGSIHYGVAQLCHACAVRYETARLRGVVRSIQQFVDARPATARA